MDDINFQDFFSDAESHLTPLCSIWTSDSDPTSTITNTTSEPHHTPIVRSVDKPSFSLPVTMSTSEDFLHASIGFCHIDTLKQHFHELYLDSAKFDHTPADAILDSGELASLWKKDRNTTPAPRPLHFGDIMHIDIVFGPEVSIGNIHYGLLFTDRFSRMTYIYPVQNFSGLDYRY